MNNTQVVRDFQPRAEAVAIEFSWHGPAPGADAIESAPECVRRAKTIGGDNILRMERGSVVFVGNGQNADPIVCRRDELPELIEWLDAHFDNGAGDDWRKPNPYTGLWFRFKDYTKEEIAALLQRERVWNTLGSYLEQEP
jgi:hypothetical protein